MPGGSAPRWGWHELDSGWAIRLVEEAAVAPGDLVLDIGAGRGELTRWLVESGARVVAVELHPRRCRHLRSRFAAAQVRVVQADASDLRLPLRPFRVVSNPPFAAVTSIIRRLLAQGSRLVSADLVVPPYAARRWSSPGAPGRRRWAGQFEVATGFRLPPGAFAPRAPRAAQVLRIRRRPGA